LRAGATTKTYNGRDFNVGGDIILKIDNKDVSKMQDIMTYVSQKQVGEKISLTIFRDNGIRQVDLILGEMPSQPPQNGSGNSPEELFDECVGVAGKSFCDFLFRR
jgi:S1-C subfamily serine protease